ncbi:hypothetical protein FQN49_002775 [Arthroderma sp. PD_2]|nr:hypothetical protein FQN49_002775 [Arthroderma sp. PD_2]
MEAIVKFISAILSLIARRVNGVIQTLLKKYWQLDSASLPNALSSNLHLSHPTHNENVSIWTDTSEVWKAALSPAEYIDEYQYLMTVPLAKDGCMTQWVLVDKTIPADKRTILASCETFRKRSITQGLDGIVKDTITHGVASVYCERKYRGRGYASRLLKELTYVLPEWQAEGTECVASVLFSDIGGDFYGNRGWRPFPSHHVEFDSASVQPPSVKPILIDDLEMLCKDDEEISRKSMAAATSGKMRHMIVPDVDHILWHTSREKFACEKLFGKLPESRGAIVGEPGNRVWVLWNHRFVGNPGDLDAQNTLYILRLVVENQAVLQSLPSDSARLPALSEGQELQVGHVRDVIQAARHEAAEWKLNSVEMWDPSTQVQNLVRLTGVPYRKEARLEDEICCLNWFRNEGDKEDAVEWVAMEKYSWC